MAQFTIQVPDGRKVTVEAADEASAMAGVQDWYGKNPAAPAPAAPPTGPSPTPPAEPESYRDSMVSQGLSGLNEGIIAKGLGGPVDLASTIINAGTSGINAMTGTKIPQITDPFLGSGTFEKLLAQVGAVSHETNDPTKQFVRRTMEEIGTSLLPSALTSKANLALMAGQLGLSALGGIGAATAKQVAPGNATAELLGEALGIGGGWGVGKAAQRALSSEPTQRLARALANDNIGPAQLNSRLSDLGPGAVMADLGPNMQGMSAALATTPGEARNTVVNALSGRQAAGNSRVQQGVEDVLGATVPESQFQTGIQTAKSALSPEYEAVFRAKALSPNFAHDTAPIADAIDTAMSQTVGHTQQQLRRVRRMLVDVNGNPVQDPQMVMSVRKELDGMIDGETNSTTKGHLKSLRSVIDQDLGAAVPGLKDVDAKFAELAKRGDAFDFGKTLLKTGENAVDPADLAGAIIQGSSGQGNARAQGLLSTITRIIGTNANDRQALAKILLGEGSWNRDKLALQFGQEKADRLVKLFDQERVKANTENLALANSKTAAVQAAQREESGAAKPPGFVKSALNLRAGDAAASLADKALGTTFAQRRASDNARLAQMLMSGTVAPQVMAELTAPKLGRALLAPVTTMALNATGGFH